MAKKKKQINDNGYSIVRDACDDYHFGKTSENQCLKIINPHLSKLETYSYDDLLELIGLYPDIILYLENIPTYVYQNIQSEYIFLKIKNFTKKHVFWYVKEFEMGSYDSDNIFFDKVHELEKKEKLNDKEIIELVSLNSSFLDYFSSINDVVAEGLIKKNVIETSQIHKCPVSMQIKYIKQYDLYIDLYCFIKIPHELYEHAFTHALEDSFTNLSDRQLMDIPRDIIMKFYHKLSNDCKVQYMEACLTYGEMLDPTLLNYIFKQAHSERVKERLKSLPNYHNDASLILNALK